MTNYERYFGSPEAAAETILSLCENAKSCEACVLHQHGETDHCGDPLTWLLKDEGEKTQECESCKIE